MHAWKRLTAGRSPQVIRGLAASTLAVGLGIAGVAIAPSAQAGGAGEWTQISDFPTTTRYPQGQNIDEPTTGRIGNNLQVLWRGQLSPDRTSYYTAVVGLDGATTTPAREIISNWVALISNPRLIRVNGQQFLAFSGLQSTTTGAPYTSGAEYAATSADGLTWSVSAGALSATTSAYVGVGNDAVDYNGTPVWVGDPGTSSGVNWHVGLSQVDPAPSGSDSTYRLAGCCAYNSAAAKDQVTGAVYTAFYSNSSTPGENGIWTGQILPNQGTFTRAAGSATNYNGTDSSIEPGQRVAMVARNGGGVYVAYKLGYPDVTGIRIMNVATGATLDVPGSAGASRISLSAGTGGRLWVAWTAGGVVKTSHTNTAVTAVGAVGNQGAPAGSQAIWKVAANSAAFSPELADENVDLVATSGSPDGQVNVWHTQALRTLGIEAQSRVARNGTINVVVTDAGEPVAGARVKIAGDSATTDSQGRARLQAPGRNRLYSITALKSGFAQGKAPIRVGG